MPKYSAEEYDEMEEEQLSKGFDRGIDYDEIKEKLINKYNELTKKLDDFYEKDDSTNSKQKHKKYNSTKRVLHNKILYVLIALIQLRNGSRCIESCAAIKVFFKLDNFKNKILVKIAKSECVKTKKLTGEEYITPRRNREIIFPSTWIDFELTDAFKVYLDMIPIIKLKQRVLQFLLREFNCNTHSLRYAFINHLLYKRKIEMGLVSKIVGHTNVNQLVRYTSQKNAQKVLDLDD